MLETEELRGDHDRRGGDAAPTEIDGFKIMQLQKVNGIDCSAGTDQKMTGEEPRNVSQFREMLPQVLATSAKSLIMLSIGMLIGFPTVLIPVLLATKNRDDLHFDIDQASWYGSLTYIFQPFGSMLSGALLQSFGCRKLMMLINIPQFACWLMVYYASSNFILYSSSGVVGFVIGLMEAPTIRYISEICHPSLRGILTTYSVLFTSLGFLVIYFLGSLTDWRHVALISSAVPIICFLVLFQVPETPMWLMSKGRPDEALESLQWLRGWTTADAVKEEFEKLKFYGKRTVQQTPPAPITGYAKEVDITDEGTQNGFESKEITIDQDGRRAQKKESKIQDENDVASVAIQDFDAQTNKLSTNFHANARKAGKGTAVAANEYEKRTLGEKWRDLTRKEMLVPLNKCIFLIVLSCFSGVPPMRPYLVKIFNQLRLPIQANWTSVLVTMLGISGNIGCMVLIKRVGKKPLVIFSSACSTVCLLLLAFSAWLSADSHKGISPALNSSWLSLVSFLVLFFSFNLGLQPIPWVYLSEILPYRGRGLATGFAASLFYITIFVGVKSFATLELAVGLHGTFLLSAVVCIVGVFFTYYVLPETEGRFLADIESEMKDSRGK